MHSIQNVDTVSSKSSCLKWIYCDDVRLIENEKPCILLAAIVTCNVYLRRITEMVISHCSTAKEINQHAHVQCLEYIVFAQFTWSGGRERRVFFSRRQIVLLAIFTPNQVLGKMRPHTHISNRSSSYFLAAVFGGMRSHKRYCKLCVCGSFFNWFHFVINAHLITCSRFTCNRILTIYIYILDCVCAVHNKRTYHLIHIVHWYLPLCNACRYICRSHIHNLSGT